MHDIIDPTISSRCFAKINRGSNDKDQLSQLSKAIIFYLLYKNKK